MEETLLLPRALRDAVVACLDERPGKETRGLANALDSLPIADVVEREAEEHEPMPSGFITLGGEGRTG